MLIGSDSFIARNFIAEKGGGFEISGASLVPSPLGRELVVNDLFRLSPKDFRGIETAVNFAAIVHRPDVKDIDIYRRANYQLPLHLARAAAEAGVAHFVQMSTVAVYGRAEEISPDTPAAPESPYGRTKLQADEALLGMRSDNFGISVLRPSMVYGGGAAPGNMMKLIRLCDRPLPLPFRGTDNRRQFAYAGLVSDALESILAGREEGVFLVADRRAVSTGELVSIIRSILGRAEMQFPLPSAASSIIRKFAPALYRKLLGSLVIHTEESFRRLQIDSSGEDLEKGIGEMVEYYRLL